jgi:cytochrome c oxidase cbb3-type subunit 4
MTYDTLRHFADSYGLAVMCLVFVGFGLWAFRPGAKDLHQAAATMIFDEEPDPESGNLGGRNNG